mmetsp:Transcript_3722/g.7734  ORF Transcript_3722/g.7734 Transcript_3722/m.7734 type:complete len:202 (+) Transcript_3722:595-1200(+)
MFLRPLIQRMVVHGRQMGVLLAQQETIRADIVVRTVVGRRKDQQVHSQHVKEQEGSHLLCSEHCLGHHIDSPLHGRHLLELALAFRFAKLPKGVYRGLVPLFEGLQIQIAGVLSRIWTAVGRVLVVALEVPHLFKELGVVGSQGFGSIYLRLQFSLEGISFQLQGIASGSEAIALGHDNVGNRAVIGHAFFGTRFRNGWCS